MARSPVSISTSGSVSSTLAFLKKMQTGSFSNLETLAQRGVDALAAATPVDSGITASSWSYVIEKKNGSTSVSWQNSNQVNGTHIAILLQYGHGTGTGGWVEGRDYINPAIRPIMDEIANEIWKQVVAG